MGLTLTPAQLRQMQEHVESCLPNEGCGLLGGQGRQVELVIPIENAAASPLRFRMDAGQQIKAQFQLEDLQLDLVGIFHSHPLGPPGPSETDLQESAYPSAVQLIWSRQGSQWNCRAFRYREGAAIEIDLELAD